MTDAEKKLLQAKHRMEEAQARDRVKERKARTRRLIQEGAILRQHRRTRKRKGPAGRFHPAGHIYAIPLALQPH